MPQKALLALLVACAGFAHVAGAETGPPTEDGLYASFEIPVSQGDRLSLWGLSVGSAAVVELGGSWTRENVELSLSLANVFDTEEVVSPRSVFARVKYFF